MSTWYKFSSGNFYLSASDRAIIDSSIEEYGYLHEKYFKILGSMRVPKIKDWIFDIFHSSKIPEVWKRGVIKYVATHGTAPFGAEQFVQFHIADEAINNYEKYDNDITEFIRKKFFIEKKTPSVLDRWIYNRIVKLGDKKVEQNMIEIIGIKNKYLFHIVPPQLHPWAKSILESSACPESWKENLMYNFKENDFPMDFPIWAEKWIYDLLASGNIPKDFEYAVNKYIDRYLLPETGYNGFSVDQTFMHKYIDVLFSYLRVKTKDFSYYPESLRKSSAINIHRIRSVIYKYKNDIKIPS